MFTSVIAATLPTEVFQKLSFGKEERTKEELQFQTKPVFSTTEVTDQRHSKESKTQHS